MTSLPRDLNADGKLEDLNGNSQIDYADVNLFFSSFDWIGANEPVVLFDFNGNGEMEFNDIVTLFERIT